MRPIHYETLHPTPGGDQILTHVKCLLPPAEVVREIREAPNSSADVEKLLCFLDVAVVGLLRLLSGWDLGAAEGIRHAVSADPSVQVCELVDVITTVGVANEAAYESLRSEYVTLTGLDKETTAGENE